ncbi:hypothetical protein Heal19_500941 [Lactiplantibacillus plantarum]|nr:hypothetical protein Heal19_500941 [Lactiplantibacillus plantarum]
MHQNRNVLVVELRVGSLSEIPNEVQLRSWQYPMAWKLAV